MEYIFQTFAVYHNISHLSFFFEPVSSSLKLTWLLLGADVLFGMLKLQLSIQELNPDEGADFGKQVENFAVIASTK